ncbi:MAG: M15 family metallopeptidase [Microthrixaceae bacterium]|nr:M15 family metallopeptidase [Microthrixaceae bacterium]
MPAELQARIASIEARFAPITSTANSVSSTTTADATSSALFSSMLAGLTGDTGSSGLLGQTGLATSGLLGQTGLGTSALGLYGTGTNSPLIANALAARNASALNSIGGVSATNASAASNGYGTAAQTRLATKSEIAAIEPTLTNGRLADSQLAPLGVGSHKLLPQAANGFKQLRAAAAAEGVTIGITDSYRSYDAQVDVARRKGLYSQGGLAAKPGTSDHGFGLAVDLDLDSEALAWMRTNASRFGFVEDTPRESWHWKFNGV